MAHATERTTGVANPEKTKRPEPRQDDDGQERKSAVDHFHSQRAEW